MRTLVLRPWTRRFELGEPVIYRKHKASTRPGPRATEVHPAERGETYDYVVEKQWRVADVRADGWLSLITRRGKLNVTSPDDPNLRRPSLWERWRLRDRFPPLERAERTRTDGARDEG